MSTETIFGYTVKTCKKGIGQITTACPFDYIWIYND